MSVLRARDRHARSGRGSLTAGKCAWSSSTFRSTSTPMRRSRTARRSPPASRASSGRCTISSSAFRAAMKRDDLMRLRRDARPGHGPLHRGPGEPRFDAVVQRDLAEGIRVQVDGTPTFFVNGHRLVGAQPFEAFVKAIDRELAKRHGGRGRRHAPGRGARPRDVTRAVRRPGDDSLVRRFGQPAAPRCGQPAQARARQRIRTTSGSIFPPSSARRSHAGAARARGRGCRPPSRVGSGKCTTMLAAPAAQTRRRSPPTSRGWDSTASGSTKACRPAARERSSSGIWPRPEAADVRGTPTFFVNGTRIDGVVSVDEI